MFNCCTPEQCAFGAWVFHTQQLEDLVDAIARGEKNFYVSDDISNEDLKYIHQRLIEKYGLDADMELN